MTRGPYARAAERNRTSTAGRTPSGPRNPHVARLGQQVKIGKRQQEAARPEPPAWTTRVTGNDPARVRIAVGRLGPVGE
jgi:hypothetical protein